MVFILNKKGLKEVVLILLIVIIMFLIIYILISKVTFKVDEEYKKINLELSSYNVDYYTVYKDDPLQKYTA